MLHVLARKYYWNHFNNIHNKFPSKTTLKTQCLWFHYAFNCLLPLSKISYNYIAIFNVSIAVSFITQSIHWWYHSESQQSVNFCSLVNNSVIFKYKIYSSQININITNIKPLIITSLLIFIFLFMLFFVENILYNILIEFMYILKVIIRRKYFKISFNFIGST